jgi:XdhC and CoxI family
MAMTAGREFAGLLSGGCLEGDLGEHARSVITSGTARVVTYDTRGPDDLVWGLGLGCEGAMRIFLLRVGPEQGYEPLEHLARALADHRATAVGVITESRRADVPLGGIVLPDGGGTGALRGEAVQGALAQARDTGKICWLSDQNGEWQLFLLPIALRPGGRLRGPSRLESYRGRSSPGLRDEPTVRIRRTRSPHPLPRSTVRGSGSRSVRCDCRDESPLSLRPRLPAHARARRYSLRWPSRPGRPPRQTAGEP